MPALRSLILVKALAGRVSIWVEAMAMWAARVCQLNCVLPFTKSIRLIGAPISIVARPSNRNEARSVFGHITFEPGESVRTLRQIASDSASTYQCGRVRIAIIGDKIPAYDDMIGPAKSHGIWSGSAQDVSRDRHAFDPMRILSVAIRVNCHGYERDLVPEYHDVGEGATTGSAERDGRLALVLERIG